MQEVLAVNIPEAARRLGLSVRTVATLVSRRQLVSRKVGRRRIIPVVALETFIRSDHPSGRLTSTKLVEGASSSAR
jgi:excisionase family DNA binding protein